MKKKEEEGEAVQRSMVSTHLPNHSAGPLQKRETINGSEKESSSVFIMIISLDAEINS